MANINEYTVKEAQNIQLGQAGAKYINNGAEHAGTFVAIHELSHVMSIDIGHGDEFWTNFKFLLENAEKAGIYKNIDYKETPQTYCGMEITDNPYFDY